MTKRARYTLILGLALTAAAFFTLNCMTPFYADDYSYSYTFAADTEKYLAEGVFAEGSMAPKIRACLRFVKNGGDKAVITEATKLADKKYGSKITMHYEDDRR